MLSGRWVDARLALLVTVLSACAERGAPRRSAAAAPPSSTAAVAPQAARPTPPGRAPVVGAEARAACAGVARFWRASESTTVRQVDTVATPYASDTTVDACVVDADQEHGMRRDAKAPVDTAAQRLGPSLALVRSTGPGWVALFHYGADGPDGTSLAYQRGRVRCLIEQTWDGGDDSDSTYVPADWFKEHTTCWMMPSVLAASDTAP